MTRECHHVWKIDDGKLVCTECSEEKEVQEAPKSGGGSRLPELELFQTPSDSDDEEGSREVDPRTQL